MGVGKRHRVALRCEDGEEQAKRGKGVRTSSSCTLLMSTMTLAAGLSM